MVDRNKSDITKEFESYEGRLRSGSDFSLIVIMISLILFCVSAWLGFGQLSDLLHNKSVRISIPDSL